MVSTGLVKAGINPNKALTAGFAAGATLSGLGAVNVSLRISTGGREAKVGLGMKDAGRSVAVHLCPRSRLASGPAIGKGAPFAAAGAPMAPRPVHRSLAIMDSLR